MKLRAYCPGDEASLSEIWFRSWLSVGLDHPVVTQDDLTSRLPRDLCERWDVTLVDSGGRLLGFLALALEERRLDQLFIAPEAQGRGIGKRLFEVARQKMPTGFWLSTQPGNARACRFYERVGMTLDRFETGPFGDRALYTFPATR